MMSARSHNAFTLVEVLAALAITAVLVAAAGSLLVGAAHVYGLLNARSRAPLENAVIILEKMTAEIQSSPVYPDIGFEGRRDRLAFPEIVALSDKGLALKDFKLGQMQTVRLGQSFVCRRAEYYFDRETRTLMKRSGDEEPQAVFSGLQDVEFSYAVSASQDSGWEWSPETPQGKEARLGAVTARLVFDPSVYKYSIPVVQKTFMVVRRHPLGAPAVETGGEEEAP